jgi:hypothetical protein
MNQFSKRLLALVCGVIGFGAVASAFTLVVEYKPYGVPDHRREEYDALVADLIERDRLLKSTPAEELPVAVVPKRSHDFGMLDPHKTATHEFEIRNNGQAPLALEVGSTSCKCTAGDLHDNLLQPGERTFIKMTWNTGYQADHYEQIATVLTNDPAAKQIDLKVSGQVRAELVAPETIKFPRTDAGKMTEASFVVFSQLWDEFTVLDVECDAPGFEWYAEPVQNDDSRLADKEPRSAWEIRAFATSLDQGGFQGELRIKIRGENGVDEIERVLSYSGKVRSPINFYSPEIHVTDGLDIGTLVAGQTHRFNLVVRARGAGQRKIEVLDVQPPELRASLVPMPTEGSYRLTLEVPKDCPMVVFNTQQKHGYVHVGDPRDKEHFSNWFPVNGAVVELAP